MDETLFAARLRAIAAAEISRFTELTKLAGLDPRRDFRHADLSGVDLRGEDLRSFDFTNAVFRGAQVLGARFNNTVKREQLQDAASTVKGVVVLIGEPLLNEAAKISDVLAPHLVVPHVLTTAIREVDADRERRQRLSGAFIGDSSDLVQRRRARPFREFLRTVPTRAAALILFEPESDFDFDTLKITIENLRRVDREPFVFLFPQRMHREEAGEAIVRARLRDFQGGTRMDMGLSRTAKRIGYYDAPSQTLSQLQRSREKALGFLSALSWSNLMTAPPLTPSRDDADDRQVTLEDGTRWARESLADAIDRTLRDETGYGPARRVVFLRSDAFTRADVEGLASRSRRNMRWDFASYPVRAGFDAQFYVLTGPPSSSIWAAVRQIASRR